MSSVCTILVGQGVNGQGVDPGQIERQGVVAGVTGGRSADFHPQGFTGDQKLFVTIYALSALSH
jgi:hypothetical protein